MKAKPKLFAVSLRDPDSTVEYQRRLIRAQTQKQVEKFIEGEALSKLRETVKVEIAGPDEIHQLASAGIKVEEIPE